MTKLIPEMASALAPGWVVETAEFGQTPREHVRFVLRKDVGNLFKRAFGPSDLVEQLSLRDFHLCSAKDRALLDAIGSAKEGPKRDMVALVVDAVGCHPKVFADVLEAAARRIRSDIELGAIGDSVRRVAR